MEWIWAGVAIVGGFVVGAVASQMARRLVEKRTGRVQQLAPAAASIAFSICLVIGLLISLGFVQPTSLEKLRDDTINYLPRVLSALIVVILGGVVGTIASTGLKESLGLSMGKLGEQIPTVLKAIITAFAAILAASQLGVDTTAINITIAAAVFGLALAFALIVGFGSRPVAAEIARGRALRRLMAPGDIIALDDFSGTVLAMHPTAVELGHGDTTTVIPNTKLSDSTFEVQRAEDPSA